MENEIRLIMTTIGYQLGNGNVEWVINMRFTNAPEEGGEKLAPTWIFWETFWAAGRI